MACDSTQRLKVDDGPQQLRRRKLNGTAEERTQKYATKCKRVSHTVRLLPVFLGTCIRYLLLLMMRTRLAPRYA